MQPVFARVESHSFFDDASFIYALGDFDTLQSFESFLPGSVIKYVETNIPWELSPEELAEAYKEQWVDADFLTRLEYNTYYDESIVNAPTM